MFWCFWYGRFLLIVTAHFDQLFFTLLHYNIILLLLYKLCVWRRSLNLNDDEEILLLVPSNFSNSEKKQYKPVTYFATVTDSGKSIQTTETSFKYPSVTPRQVWEIDMMFIIWPYLQSPSPALGSKRSKIWKSINITIKSQTNE